MISDTGVCDRRARRSSVSRTSSAWVRLKQPVRPSRRLFSRSSWKNCALRIEIASSAPAIASTRCRAGVNGPAASGIPSMPTGWPPAVSGMHRWPPAAIASEVHAASVIIA